ncbi:MAG: hypothetical protein HYX75_02070 [Acidobacteria bacterium]|nr:hypothetical protein [Acidobacteriota bacterium]
MATKSARINSAAGDLSLGVADGTVRNGTVIADGALLNLDESTQGGERITIEGCTVEGQGVLGSIKAQTDIGS